MLTSVATFAIDGLEARRIAVEVDVRSGLPAFSIVGLADTAAREARERVQAALRNSGFEFPPQRVTANLAPATFRKVGPSFDLALALAVLIASGQLEAGLLDRTVVFGEVSLSGALRGCPGALAVAQASNRAGFKRLILPTDRAVEATLQDDLEVVPARDLNEVVDVLKNLREHVPVAGLEVAESSSEVDLSDVRGHTTAIHALTIAAAGGHNVLMQGPPGTGKTMLARRLPTILPPLDRAEMLAVARIKSVTDALSLTEFSVRRPFRSPHHTISSAGLVGDGREPSPGEVTLAHHGVLFLDEIAEFPRSALEALRQPLEDGYVTIVRGQRSLRFPSKFMLVAATNPCACGYWGSQVKQCHCSELVLQKYRRKLSGPLLDRIDIAIDVQRPSAAQLSSQAGVASEEVRERVLSARERQAARFKTEPDCSCNAQMTARALQKYASITGKTQQLLDRAYDRGQLSARGRARVIRVARTLADLEGRDRIETQQILEAITLRVSDSLEDVSL